MLNFLAFVSDHHSFHVLVWILLGQMGLEVLLRVSQRFLRHNIGNRIKCKLCLLSLAGIIGQFICLHPASIIHSVLLLTRAPLLRALHQLRLAALLQLVGVQVFILLNLALCRLLFSSWNNLELIKPFAVELRLHDGLVRLLYLVHVVEPLFELLLLLLIHFSIASKLFVVDLIGEEANLAILVLDIGTIVLTVLLNQVLLPRLLVLALVQF